MSVGDVCAEAVGRSPSGFYDAVAVRSRTIAERYLSLDQSMTMAAISNELTGDTLKDYFVDREMEETLRPAMRQQDFGPSWRESGERN